MIRILKVRDLDPETYHKVYSLNLRGRGHARGHIKTCFNERHEYSEIILDTVRGVLRGWALLVQCLNARARFVEYSINMYVRKTLRRRGIGARLFKVTCGHLARSKRRGHVAIWSADSEYLYRRYVCRRIRVVVSPRYQLTLS